MRWNFSLQSPIKFNVEAPAPNTVITRPSTRELGQVGHNMSGGILRHEDYNTDLRPEIMYDIYDRMRLGDGQIGGLLNAVKMPILNVDWRIEPATEDEADVQIADWLFHKLNVMTTSFESVMHEILLYLDYGSMPMEKVWDLDENNLIVLRKLAPRMPKSVVEWKLDSHGGLRGIKQRVTGDNWSLQGIDIPVKKLLVFVNGKEGSNWRGISILRRAYKHWYYKDNMYKIDAIAKERRGVGIDVGTLKGNEHDNRDEIDLQYALMGLHAHEKQFFIEQDEKYTYRIEGLDGQPLPILDSIEHHDSLILRSMLAEFIALGDKGGGSYALSEDKSTFFTMSLNSIAKYIADIFNRHLIPQWVNYNWTADKYPKLMYSRLETRDGESIARAIRDFARSGFIKPHIEDEYAIRDMLELPSIRHLDDDVGVPFSGAQIQGIVRIAEGMGKGIIGQESAFQILKVSFPGLTDEQINHIVANVGAGIENGAI